MNLVMNNSEEYFYSRLGIAIETLLINNPDIFEVVEDLIESTKSKTDCDLSLGMIVRYKIRNYIGLQQVIAVELSNVFGNPYLHLDDELEKKIMTRILRFYVKHEALYQGEYEWNEFLKNNNLK